MYEKPTFTAWLSAMWSAIVSWLFGRSRKQLHQEAERVDKEIEPEEALEKIDEIQSKSVDHMKMQTDLIGQYDLEKEVEINGDKYLVRDNGAVYRRHRPGCRRRSLDEKWTFGRHDQWSGYMHIGSHVVHRIVAFAFLGNPPSEKHIVDHIDTNKCNNRAGNLRWVTRLENMILNPITLKRIIIVWGSLDNFFENPRAAPRLKPNIDWMRTVSKEEAERCREQLLKWAESDALPKGGNLGEWVYGTRQPSPQISESKQDIQSLSPMAVQRRWKTPTEFPCCPTAIGPDPLADYARNLGSDAVFSRDRYKESSVVMAEQGDGILSVLTASKQKDPVKPWAVAKVTVENGKFVHEGIGTFFELNGAKKAHYRLLGIPFSAESIDDYC